MNTKIIGLTIILALFIIIFLKYDILTSSNNLITASKYKNEVKTRAQINTIKQRIGNVRVEVEDEMNNIMNQAKQDTEDNLLELLKKLHDLPPSITPSGIIEKFQNETKNNKTQKQHTLTIILFYSLTCPQCHRFLPTWNLVKESIPKGGANLTEIESSSNPEMAARYGISSVPTILIMRESKVIDTLLGEKTFEDIAKVLKMYGIQIEKPDVKRTSSLEGFVDYISAAQIESESSSDRKTIDPDCPFISFYQSDKDYYCADSNYLYGCMNATSGSGIAPFDAAFGVIESYLLSLPDNNLDKMKKCASNHSTEVKQWGLCNAIQLNNKSQYSNDIESGIATKPFLNVNYDDNKDVVNAINYACSLKSY